MTQGKAMEGKGWIRRLLTPALLLGAVLCLVYAGALGAFLGGVCDELGLFVARPRCRQPHYWAIAGVVLAILGATRIVLKVVRSRASQNRAVS